MLHFLLLQIQPHCVIYKENPSKKKEVFPKLESSSSKKILTFSLRIRILESGILMKVSSKTECHTISRERQRRKKNRFACTVIGSLEPWKFMGFFFEGPAMAKTKGILNSCWLLCKIHRDSQIPYLHTHIMAFPQIKKENTIYQDPRYIWRWPEAKLTLWRKNEILLLCLLFSVFWEQIGVWKMKESSSLALKNWRGRH